MNSSRPRHLLLVCEDSAPRGALEESLSEVANATLAVAGEDQALDRLRDRAWDVAIFYAGPSLSRGLDLLVHVQAEELPTGVVLIGQDVEAEQAVLAMRSGALNVLDIRQASSELSAAVVRGLQKTHVSRLLAEHKERERTTLALAHSRMAAMQQEIAALHESIIDALLSALEARERTTRAHSARVCAYSAALARAAGYPANLLPHLLHAAVLHDIGKTALPAELMARQGELPSTQLDAYRPHTWLGEKILNSITFLRPAARLVRHHHERWDGSGYPDKLEGENIPLGSRILTVCDALDALTNDQVYRPAQTFEDAAREICRWTRRQFDPMLVAKFQQIPIPMWEQIRSQLESDSQMVPAPSQAWEHVAS